MPDPIDPYKALQVDPEAEVDVIQAAYRRLARKYHPDLAEAPDAAGRMAAINAAWELLRDPMKRAAHDRTRASAIAASGTSGPGDAPAWTGTTSTSGGQAPPPETVSRDWTSGRSSQGGGYDQSMRRPDGFGAAGPPPGRPSGSVLDFGRYAGWSLGEIARHDIEFIEWLDRTPIGRNYRDEVDGILRATGRRKSTADQADERRGLYRRR